MSGTTRREPRSWRWALTGLLLVALLGGGAWTVLASPLLAVNRVVVDGARVVPARQVLAAADVPVGGPLSRVDTAAVAARVERIPRIADALVVRRWPGTLAVVVVERSALAGVRTGKGYALMDGEAVVFDRVAKLPAGVPVVKASGLDPRRSLRAVLKALDSLPPALRARVGTATATTVDDVTLSLDGDKRVVWGSADRGARKAVVLRALLRQEADVYDVSAPDAPTTR